jgi:hypothetical protein
MNQSFDQWVADRREAWWQALSEDDRTFLVACAEADECPPRAVELLLSHGSPHGPIGTKWEGERDYAWDLTEPWRDFLLTRSRTA